MIGDRKITLGGVEATIEGLRDVGSGVTISWEGLSRILIALPEIAHLEIGWFPLMGPPSKCAQAATEALDIRGALFPRRPSEEEMNGFDDGGRP